MAKRKGKLKALGLFGAVFFCGGVVGGGLVAWRYLHIFKQQYYERILSNANTAYMIRADVQDELLEQLERSIEQFVISADSLWGNDKARLDAFWYVQRYYEKYKLPVPDNIKSILGKLPPDPRQEKFCRFHTDLYW